MFSLCFPMFSLCFPTMFPYVFPMFSYKETWLTIENPIEFPLPDSTVGTTADFSRAAPVDVGCEVTTLLANASCGETSHVPQGSASLKLVH